jgi:GNAT superfamily N-acetyltransferase
MTALRIDEFPAIAASQDDEVLIAAFNDLEPAPPAGPSEPPQPDATLMLARRGERPVARLTYRWVHGLKHAPEETGVIGQYEAEEEAAGVALLERAVAALAAEGAARVVGPMDSTTWGRYRLALPTPEAGDPAPFMTEPMNPLEYAAHFEAAGFSPVERYVSWIVPDLDALAGRAGELADELAGAGWALTPLDPARIGNVLDELYDLSVAAFADDPYYSRISRERFRDSYKPVRDFFDPELVLLARDAENRLRGFAFAFPDLFDPAGTPTRAVLKSLAVHPSARGAGIGSLLVHEIHRRAAAKGYESAIHALMQVDNPAHNISRHGGKLFRRYALFGRDM